jgi:hypothetical protein
MFMRDVSEIISFLRRSIFFIYRQFLSCIHKCNRLIQIDYTDVGSETLDN